MITTSPSLRYTARDWNEVRAAFSSSILVDTRLSSLAQNLEGGDWPLKGPEETPAGYIDLSFEEMREQLALRGQHPRMADHLIDILKETLAFDDPFGEMVTQSETAAARDNPLLKNLARLGLPENFPITLTALTPETLAFCQLESVTTLREFACLAQRMAQNVIVGGDFRGLLNALSNIDEAVIARYLPFRRGSTGVHYVEGLAQAVLAQPIAVQAALARRARHPLTQAETDLASTVSGVQLKRALDALAQRGSDLRVFCEEECQTLVQNMLAGTEPRQLTHTLNDPAIRAVVADLLRSLVPPSAVTPAASGLISRITHWFKK